LARKTLVDNPRDKYVFLELFNMPSYSTTDEKFMYSTVTFVSSFFKVISMD